MFSAILSMVPGLFSLGGKMIEDKDKKNEYAFKVLEMTQAMSMKMLDVKTYPWIDGLVKLAYAADQIVKGLIRPVGSGILTGVVIYCAVKGIDLPDTIDALGAAAFPGWMASRHIEKAKKAEKLPDDYDF